MYLVQINKKLIHTHTQSLFLFILFSFRLFRFSFSLSCLTFFSVCGALKFIANRINKARAVHQQNKIPKIKLIKLFVQLFTRVLDFYAQGFSSATAEKEARTHSENTYKHIYIFFQIYTHFAGSLSPSPTLQRAQHIYICTYVHTHVLTFRFFFSVFALLMFCYHHTHACISTRTSTRQQAKTKTTDTTTIKTIITLLLLRCGTT